MTISYKWLLEYIPGDKTATSTHPDPDKLARILTSIGLEVEGLHKFEEVKGGLAGLVVGEVVAAEKHPNADKLTLTRVNTGNGEPLQIVCGAPNVKAGQKVIVAKVGTTIYPLKGEPLTMRMATIRNVESYGMIVAEDEIGLGESHDGIIVLNPEARIGSQAADHYDLYEDWIIEIGITPNRMDAMSHWGVARDVCAWLSHHEKKPVRPVLPSVNSFKPDSKNYKIGVTIENQEGCARYSGVCISGISVGESPKWLKQKLKAIGLRPINNIVDITNFIQHETGQPLHAFDADKIAGKQIIVRNLPQGSIFVSLDEKERSLSSEDLMICDAEGGLCIAGVFGGINSGVVDETTNIFLESAWFNPVHIRKTSFRHNLRTDAATRFEKNVDISNTVNVLKRAAMMIKEIAGGKISSEIVDVYPAPADKKEVTLKYHYLRKLSGKQYHPDTVKDILQSLGFEVIKEGIDEIRISVPHHKSDISLQADIVEEILRIDGLDNVEIPEAVTMSPSVEENLHAIELKEKISGYLVGLGFNEIMTNSITNAGWYDESSLRNAVRMMNNLSADLNMMRLNMVDTGLEAIAFNLNRKNEDLRFFEFGKTYESDAEGTYIEAEHCCLYVTGRITSDNWKSRSVGADIYYLKGLIYNILRVAGVKIDSTRKSTDSNLNQSMEFIYNGERLALLGEANGSSLSRFEIRQRVFIADIDWERLVKFSRMSETVVQEIPRFPVVYRDLALVVDRSVAFGQVEKSVQNLKLPALREVRLFDIFESEKIGAGRKSMALSFSFVDNTRTLTDKEVEGWMNMIMGGLQKDVNAEIRK